MDNPTKILDYLYLGSFLDVNNGFPQSIGTKLILNFAEECEYESEIEQKHWKFYDNYNQNLVGHFDHVVEIIKAHVDNDQTVFIHCFAGKSRSVSFVLAYLMKTKKLNLQEAYDFVSNKRDIYPNVNFVKQLVEYEIQLYGESTFDYDKYVVDNIYSTFSSSIFDVDKEIIHQTYLKCNKDLDMTIDLLLKK